MKAEASTVVELKAPADWQRIEFLSDLHLSDATPRSFEAFTTYLRSTTADALFILGDLFDAWIGDDARHDGFEARCAGLLREASAERRIGFMRGNRDFLVGAEMLDDCGVMALDDPTIVTAFGQRLLLSHGDAWCVDDVAYQQVRRQLRSAAWQQNVLARPLDERRALARAMRTQSIEHQALPSSAAGVDVDPATAVRWMRKAGAATVVHGHTHRPGSNEMARGFTRHVLSDWDFDHPGAPRGDVLRWQAGGLTRLAADGFQRAA